MEPLRFILFLPGSFLPENFFQVVPWAAPFGKNRAPAAAPAAPRAQPQPAPAPLAPKAPTQSVTSILTERRKVTPSRARTVLTNRAAPTESTRRTILGIPLGG